MAEGDTTNFVWIMGSSPMIKILDFLIENDRESWSMNEVHKHANIAYSTLKLLFPKLVDKKIVVITKQIGKLKLYRINKDNPITIKLVNLHKTITEQFVNEIYA